MESAAIPIGERKKERLEVIALLIDSFNKRYGLVALPGYTLFFLMLFVPTTYQMVKGILLSITLMIIFFGMLKDGLLNLHPSVILWTLFYVLIGMFFSLLGVVNNNPGWLAMMKVYTIWPIVFMLLVAGVSSERGIFVLVKILTFSCFAIGAYGICYLLNVIDVIPDNYFIKLDLGLRLGIYSRYIESNLFSISTLLFIVPFLTAALIMWKVGESAPASRAWMWTSLSIGLFFTLITGRRALLLIILFAPVCALTLRLFTVNKRIKATRGNFFRFCFYFALIVTAAFVLLRFVTDFSFAALWEWIRMGFEVQSGQIKNLRGQQFYVLLNEWYKSPYIGAGHGAASRDCVRSVTMPWAYELSYMNLLFSTGIIGFIAYSSGVVWIIMKGLKMTRTRHRLAFLMPPVLTGMICFLIANATNPYLSKFDYFWVIFLPVAIINKWMLDNKSGNSG